jgi:serine/threonine-protein kinase
MAPFPSPDRWKRLEDLFQRAADLNAEERLRFLDESCGEDTQLRHELESLLESANETNEFIEKPLQQVARQLSASRSALAAGSKFGHYEIVSVVGAGGMGKVYLALDSRLGRKAALKTLTPEFVHDEHSLRRLAREARTASALNHPNILTIYEVGQFEGTHFIASEFVDGPNLREKLQAGRMEAPEAIEIAIQIAAGLNAAHAVGIVHRDIKPENVVLREDGLVKVVDFGIAKLGEPPEAEIPKAPGIPATATTQPGMVVGTARYMSPEQVRGLPVDGRTDIFSLGTVLYEMLAGKAPFEGATHSDVFAEILKTDPAPLGEVAPQTPRELSRIVSKAMCKEREGRYQTAGEMLAALQTVRRNLELGVVSRAPGALVRAWQARSGWRIVAGLVVIAAAIGTYMVWKSETRIPAPQRSLAILPFRNIRQDPATDFLGFSLADAVITKLGYIRSLTVRPSSSIDRYRNQVIDPRKVGADLNVETLLTGSFLKDGEDLRINTQLVDLKPLRII